MGYVQVKLLPGTSVVKGRVTPEHKINKTPYTVEITVDNESHLIDSAKCYGCPAQNGGCKHVVAFIFWLYRRSTEQAVTEVTCYWRKPSLSDVTRLSPIRARDLTPRASGRTLPSQPNFLKQIMDRAAEKQQTPAGAVFSVCQQSTNSILKDAEMRSLCKGCNDSSKMTSVLAEKMDRSTIEKVVEATKDQSKSPTWHHQRFGRVTGSKLHAAAQCRTPQGSLVESILGSKSFGSSNAMKRGMLLEPLVLSQLEKFLGEEIRPTGLHILQDRPMFAASPDGICSLGGVTHVVEVKCPSAEKNVSLYVDNDIIAAKVRVQIQMEMLAVGVTNAVLCIADPAFEENGNIRVVFDTLDRAFLEPFMERAEKFWYAAVFPLLIR